MNKTDSNKIYGGKMDKLNGLKCDNYVTHQQKVDRGTYVELHHSKSFICLSLYSERQMNDFEWCNST